MNCALKELQEHQTQLDMDGVMVGVSRQALEEVLNEVTQLRTAITTAEERAAETLALLNAEITLLREAIARLREALFGIRYHSDNQDIDHKEYRIKARECADHALSLDNRINTRTEDGE